MVKINPIAKIIANIDNAIPRPIESAFFRAASVFFLSFTTEKISNPAVKIQSPIVKMST